MAFAFENKRHPVAPRKRFFYRLLLYTLAGCIFIFMSLWIGAIGYKYFADLTWVDAFYNASMILTGMGPVVELHSDTSKIFATMYSIYSGVAFITSIGVIFAPLIHRILHKLNAPLQDK